MKIKRHISYGKYVIKHKYYVFKACMKLGVPIIQALMHDMSKFLPSEWIHYSKFFYKINGEQRDKPFKTIGESKKLYFDHAWNHHQKCNKHHWQYWISNKSKKEYKVLEIPRRYVKEMVADWWGFELTHGNNKSPREWFDKNKNTMILHSNTMFEIDLLIKYIDLLYRNQG